MAAGEWPISTGLVLASPDSLWGGRLEYPAGKAHALAHGVSAMPSIFMSKSIWHKPVRHHRSIHAVRRFERNFVNLLLVSGSGAMNFRSSTHSVVVEAGNFFCTKADRAYLCVLLPTGSPAHDGGQPPDGKRIAPGQRAIRPDQRRGG